ncbi:hypothetical protein ACFYY2_33595 [Streptomyces sp. NPDC001822]|uniref:hypothetical protein n=1 Tax=Streptomyces sp. NPDC001822 TaxID=3364614 RepID=UPI0036C3A140
MYRSLRALAVAVAGLALAVSLDAPAHAAASGRTHHFSGQQICISTTGDPGSTNPGTVRATWTNPPRHRTTATVHITHPSGLAYTLTARRRGGRLVATFTPGIQKDGKTCARFQGSRRTACVQITDRH